MAYIQTNSDGRITTIYYGVNPDGVDWVEVNSDLLNSVDEMYLIDEATEPELGWDKDDGVIGVVQS